MKRSREVDIARERARCAEDKAVDAIADREATVVLLARAHGAAEDFKNAVLALCQTPEEVEAVHVAWQQHYEGGPENNVRGLDDLT